MACSLSNRPALTPWCPSAVSAVHVAEPVVVRSQRVVKILSN